MNNLHVTEYIHGCGGLLLVIFLGRLHNYAGKLISPLGLEVSEPCRVLFFYVKCDKSSF